MDFFQRILFEHRNIDIGREFAQLVVNILEDNNIPAESWDDAFSLLEQFVDDPQALAANVRNAIRQLIGQLTIDESDVKAWIGALRERLLAEVPEELRPLLLQLDELRETPLSWPVLDKSANGAGQHGQLALSFKAGGKLAFEIDILSPEEVQALPDAPAFPAGTEGLQLAANGFLSASAGAKLPFSYGSFGAGVEGRIEFWLDYLFQHRSRSLLAQALLPDIVSLPYPRNPRAVASAYSDALRRVHLVVDGQVKLSAELALGRVWEKRYATESTDGNPAEVTGTASIAASFKTTLTPKGRFEITLTPEPDARHVTIALKRKRSSSLGRELKLGAAVQIEGLDQLAAPLVKHYLKDAQPLIDKLEALSRPSEWIVEQLTASGLIGDTSLRQQIGEALFADEGRTDLTDLLREKISAEIDGLEEKWTPDSDALAEEVLRRAVDRLDLPEELARRLIDAAEAPLKTAFGNYRAGLENKLKDIFSQLANAPALARLFGVLDEIEAGVTHALQQANNKAARAVAPVLELVNRYQALRAKLVRAAEGAAQLRIGVAYAMSRTVERGEDIALQLRVDTGNDTARALFERMMRGDFSEALTAARESADTSGLTILGGSFSKFVTDTQQMGVTANFFGNEFQSRTVLSSAVRATWDLNGNIVAWTSEAAFTSYKKARGEAQSINFLSAYQHAGEHSSGQPVLATPLSAALSQEEDELDEEELREFLEPMESVGLVATGTVDNAVASLFVRGGRSVKRLKQTVVGVAVNLTDTQWDTFVNRPSERVQRVAIGRLVETLKLLGIGFGARDFDRYLLRLGDGDVVDVLYGLRDLTRGRIEDRLEASLEAIIPEQRERRRRSGLTAAKAHDILDAADKLWTIKESMREMLTLDMGQPAGVDRAHQLNRAINSALREWLKTRLVGDEPRPSTLAFFCAVLELAGVDLELAPLIPVFSQPTEEGRRDERLLI